MLIRDEIWGRLRFALQGDHRFHKQHKLYDFPQKDLKTRVTNAFLIFLSKLPPVRRKMQAGMAEAMVMAHKKVVDESVQGNKQS